jgi:hypothetical protein
MPKPGTSGWRTQTAKQMGEALVVAELARRNYLATAFSGNVPDFDLVAIREDLSGVPLQVKTLRRGGSWQGNANRHLKIRQDGKKQIIEGLQDIAHPRLLWVFVYVPDSGHPEYFVLSAGEVQEIVRRKYSAHLGRHGGGRPRKPESMHMGIKKVDLEPHRDAWSRIDEWRGV